MMRIRGAVAVLAVLMSFAPARAAQPLPFGLRVSGTVLKNSSGQVVRLFGVNRQGTEYACSQGWGFADGPMDDASFNAIASWHANAVRVPMNEDCWLGRKPGLNLSYTGAPYRAFIAAEVARIKARNMVAILDLHLAAPNGRIADGLLPMPDADNSPDFWRSVAATFKDDPGVIFDLYNEPYPTPAGYENRAGPGAWTCWKTGVGCGLSFTPVGMQTLADAVRSTGAGNLMLAGGLWYSSRMNQWLAHRPADARNNLAVSWHVYSFSDCNSTTCWNAEAVPVMDQVPVVVLELGQDDCLDTFVTPFMDWLDTKNASYLAWAWFVYPNLGNGDQVVDTVVSVANGAPPCFGPTLILDYGGTPKGLFGVAVQNRFARHNG